MLDQACGQSTAGTAALTAAITSTAAVTSSRALQGRALKLFIMGLPGSAASAGFAQAEWKLLQWEATETSL